MTHLYFSVYIKDRIHYSNKSKRTVKTGTIIVTFDVSSLHTSIPHDLGIEALTYYLRTFNHTIDSRFNINFILDLLYVITCPGCNEEYIGQTGRTLRERVVATL